MALASLRKALGPLRDSPAESEAHAILQLYRYSVMQALRHSCTGGCMLAALPSRKLLSTQALLACKLGV